jgi:hypothetical protein
LSKYQISTLALYYPQWHFAKTSNIFNGTARSLAQLNSGWHSLRALKIGNGTFQKLAP